MFPRGRSTDARRPWAADRSGSGTRRTLLASLLVCVAVTGATLAFVPAVGVGVPSDVPAAHEDEQDFAPPEVTVVERIDTDTVRLVLDDNHDVDEGTVDQNDFEVTPGRVAGISVGQNGTNADVELVIEGAGNQAVTVSSTNATDIEDTNGNEFDPTGQFSAVVSAPGDLPQIHNATWADATTAEQYEGEINWPDDKPGETTSVEVYLTDGVGIDTTSIDADDFTVSRSRVTDVATRTDGENAFVLLVLSQNLDDGALGDGGLTVALADDAEIRDTEGRVGNRIERPGEEFTLYNTAPRLAGGSRINDTAVELLFVDDADVAETSIQAEDFQIAGADLPDTEVSDFGEGNVDPRGLREYRIASTNVTEQGSNASVVLRMPREVDDDELLVRVREGATITDSIGNRFAPADDDVRNRVLVDGMDGVAPTVGNFSLIEENAGSVTLSVAPSERLDGIDVSVEGAVNDSLDRSAFTFVESRFAYETTYTRSQGTLAFHLNSVTDEAGNTGQVDEIRVSSGVPVERRPPEPVVAIDFAASENHTLVFDARHTSGPNPVSNYTWEFDDGTTATGLRATKQFEPGTHLVALTATDSEGRSATDTASLDLTSGVDAGNLSVEQLGGVRRVASPELRIVQSGDDAPGTALLEVENPSPGIAVSASDSLPNGNALAAGEDVEIDDVEVVPARYDGFSLSVSTSGAGSVTDAASATDTQAIGGFSVAHDVPDEDFESATISTSVDPERLDGLDASSEDVAILRRNDGSWQRLPTSSVSETTGTATHQFRAESPGFSRFAVVAGTDSAGTVRADSSTPLPTQEARSNADGNGSQPDGRADVLVRKATLNESTVQPGTTVLVNATVENPSEDNTLYTAGLSVDGTVVATESVALPAGEERPVSFTYEANETGTVPVSVNGTAAGELTVGSGGLLGSMLGLFDPILGLFGFLPLGLLRPVVVFVGVPLLVVFLILKALAIYLGY